MVYDLLREEERVLPFKRDFVLYPEFWKRFKNSVALNWSNVPFNATEVLNVPEKRGVYAFFIEPGVAGFPHHAYLVYVGKAGDESSSTLRARFRSYVQEQRRLRRPRVHVVLRRWAGNLKFYYVEIGDLSVDIAKLERSLIDAFLPYCNVADYSVKIRRLLKVLR